MTLKPINFGRRNSVSNKESRRESRIKNRMDRLHLLNDRKKEIRNPIGIVKKK